MIHDGRELKRPVGRWFNDDRLTVIGLDPGSSTRCDLDVVKQSIIVVAGGTIKGSCVAIVLCKAPAIIPRLFFWDLGTTLENL